MRPHGTLHGSVPECVVARESFGSLIVRAPTGPQVCSRVKLSVGVDN